MEGMLEQAGDFEESGAGDEGEIGEVKEGGSRLGHPCGYDQPVLGQIDPEDRRRLAADEEGHEPLPGPRVKRVVDGDRRITGLVMYVSGGGRLRRSLSRSPRAARRIRR